MKVIIFICSILISSQTIAAAPITHVYLAQNWIDSREHFNQLEKASFIRGTLFPDIRYLGVITRKETHDSKITLQDILDEHSPFSKGRKFHSFVDKKRQQLVTTLKIYDHLKIIPKKYRGTFLKLLEDEILFDKRDWKEIRAALTKLDDGYDSYDIKQIDLIKWHILVEKAFQMPPSKYMSIILENDKIPSFGIPKEIIKEWSPLLPIMAKDEKFKDYIKNLTGQFEDLFHKSKSQKKSFIPTHLLNHPSYYATLDEFILTR